MILVARDIHSSGDYTTYTIKLIYDNGELADGSANLTCTEMSKEEAMVFLLKTGKLPSTSLLVDTDDHHEAIDQWVKRLHRTITSIPAVVDFQMKKVL